MKRKSEVTVATGSEDVVTTVKPKKKKSSKVAATVVAPVVEEEKKPQQVVVPVVVQAKAEVKEQEVEILSSVPPTAELVFLDSIDKQHNRNRTIFLQVKLIRKWDVFTTTKGSKSISGRFQDKNGNQIGFGCWSSKENPGLPDALFDTLKLNEYYTVFNFEVLTTDRYNRDAGLNESFKMQIYADKLQGTIIEPLSYDDNLCAELMKEFIEPVGTFIPTISDIPTLFQVTPIPPQNTAPLINVVGVITERKRIYEWRDPKKNFQVVPISNVVIIDEHEVAVDVCLFGTALNEIEYPVGCILRVEHASIRSKNTNVFTLSPNGNVIIINHLIADEVNPRIEQLRQWSILNKTKIQSQFFDSLSNFKRQYEDYQPSSSFISLTTSSSSSSSSTTPTIHQVVTIAYLLELKEQAKSILTERGLLHSTTEKKVPNDVVLPKGVYTVIADVMKVHLAYDKAKSIIEPSCINKNHKSTITKRLMLSSDESLRCTECKEVADEWEYTPSVKLEIMDKQDSCLMKCYNLDPFVTQPYNIQLEDLLREARKKQKGTDEEEPLEPKDHLLYHDQIFSSVNHLVTHPFTSHIITLKLVKNIHEGLEFQMVKVQEPSYYTNNTTTTSDETDEGRTSLAVARSMFAIDD